MLDWDSYFERLVRLRVEFELAKKALEDWSGHPELIRKHAERDFASMREMISKALSERQVEPKSHWIFDSEAVASYLESAQKSAAERATAFKNRLSQNEFLLQVTIFEGFLKDIYTEKF